MLSSTPDSNGEPWWRQMEWMLQPPGWRTGAVVIHTRSGTESVPSRMMEGSCKRTPIRPHSLSMMTDPGNREGKDLDLKLLTEPLSLAIGIGGGSFGLILSTETLFLPQYQRHPTWQWTAGNERGSGRRWSGHKWKHNVVKRLAEIRWRHPGLASTARSLERTEWKNTYTHRTEKTH